MKAKEVDSIRRCQGELTKKIVELSLIIEYLKEEIESIKRIISVL